jgi:hypothetical protein
VLTGRRGRLLLHNASERNDRAVTLEKKIARSVSLLPQAPFPDVRPTQLPKNRVWYRLFSNFMQTLRRTLTPYLGQTVILTGVTLFSFFVALKTHQWDFLWAPLVIWALYGCYVVAFGMPYRVYWDEACVMMRASGGPQRNIRFEDISEVRYEIARSDEYLSQSRPFRRVVIHGRDQKRNCYIDISLRHFHLEDIRDLMSGIRKYRPDLTLPQLPV